MKKLIVFIAFFTACSCFSGFAQVNVQFNVGLQPLWGPVGYDYVRYYYLPDVDVYYDVTARQYIYFNNGSWVRLSSLPPVPRGFDIYNSYKVVINDPDPWVSHNRYRDRYYHYRGRHTQAVIRDSRDQRYWANPRHPKHRQWRGTEKSHDWGGHRSNEKHGQSEKHPKKHHHRGK